MRIVLLLLCVLTTLSLSSSTPAATSGAATHLANDIVRSNDDLVLTFDSRTSTALNGEPGTNHRLAFVLKNNGNAAVFDTKIESSHPSFLGTAPTGFSVQAKQVQTIVIDGLKVPQDVAKGTKIQLTLTATKTGNQLTDKMFAVSKSVYFTVGDPPLDETKPQVKVDVTAECPVPRNSTQCMTYQWHVEYLVKDPGSGLLQVDVHATGKDSVLKPVRFSYPNFVLGSRDQVEVTCDISCCVAGVSLRAVDVAGIENTYEFLQGHNGGSKSSLSAAVAMLAAVLLAVAV